VNGVGPVRLVLPAKLKSGRTTIRNRQAKILFIPTSWGSESPRIREVVRLLSLVARDRIRTAEGLKASRHKISYIATNAIVARDLPTLRAATDALLELEALDQVDGGARYLESWCLRFQRNLDEARKALEDIVENDPAHRARALLSLGWIHFERGQGDKALPFYAAAARIPGNHQLVVLAESLRMTAVVRALQGDHIAAINELERLPPLIHAVSRYYPSAYYQYLNSLAVEFGEVGRIADAKRVCSITLASPYAACFPEWAETKKELDEKQPDERACLIAVDRVPESDQPKTKRSARKQSPAGCPRLCLPFHHFVPSQRAIDSGSFRFTPRNDAATQSNSLAITRFFNSLAPRGPPNPWLRR
jgi:tetratricopeptide (TPR) repeat protein